MTHTKHGLPFVLGSSHGNLAFQPTAPVERVARVGEPRPTVDYRLPDGTVVAIYEDTCRNEPSISYQLKGGRIVRAVRVS